jgi:pimeloyl-ACP methyl ester carboxylesterase
MSDADLAPTQFAAGPRGERFAYRRFGEAHSRPPLVLVHRTRGTIDHWDPALLDALARDNDVVLFDHPGVNESTGTPATKVSELADGVIAFVRTLGLAQVDLLGWSLGGIVAQGVALAAPELVRRLVLAASTPGAVPGAPAMSDRVRSIIARPANDDEDFLYLFFPQDASGRAAGKASLDRLRTRLDKSNATLSAEAVKGQLTAIASFTGYWDRLDELALPVLLANGTRDVMISSDATYAAVRRLKAARALLWSDAGHGFLFQHAEEFARQVTWFLASDL